jgi:hypothetical protein
MTNAKKVRGKKRVKRLKENRKAEKIKKSLGKDKKQTKKKLIKNVKKV